jgi:hypothetical protein
VSAAHAEDYGHEPTPGLPQLLPPGERILWQGRPAWRSFARHSFHLVPLTLYFVALAAWRLTVTIEDGATATDIALAVAWPIGLGGLLVGLTGLLAWYAARTTRYTITNRRVVFRIGVALTVSVNLPFNVISSAALRRHRDGTGDITLAIAKPARVSWVMFWPHARPWRFSAPQPMLRNVAEPERVAQILSRALAASAAMPVTAVAPAGPAAQDGPARAPAPSHGEPVAA